MLGYFKENKGKKCQKKKYFSSQNHDFFKSQK